MRKIILRILLVVTGALSGMIISNKIYEQKLNKLEQLSNKHLSLFLMMNQWLKAKQDGKDIVGYFEKNQYKRIAIYGMSYVGKTLLNELKESEIDIAFAVDRNLDDIYADINIVSINDSWEDIDVVVVTAITFFDEIEQQLLTKVNCPIVSLEDILSEI